MNILVISRRRHFNTRQRFIKEIYPNANIINCSDERNVSGKAQKAIWWGDYSKGDSIDIKYDINDIVKRCRFLREFSEEKSESFIQLAFKRWDNILTTHNIDLIYCLPIDSYVTQTLEILSVRRNIPLLSTVGTLFNNRIRITKYGELVRNNNANINNQEVEEFIQNVRKATIRPNWLIGVGAKPSKTAFKRMVIDFFKPYLYSGYRIINNDKDSFSFPNKKLYKKRMFSTLNRFFWAKKIEKVAIEEISDDKEFYFIPLQFYPEVTSDYWNRNLELINHHEVVLKVINSLPNQLFVIKEHPAAYGRRDEQFLKELSSLKNVVFVKLLSDLNYWLNKATLIIGNASTTTINAITLKKAVLFFTEPYFGSKKENYLSNLDANHIFETTEKVKKISYSEDEIKELIKLLFENCAEGSLGSYKPLGEKSNVSDIMVTEDLVNYVEDYRKSLLNG